MEVVWMFRLTNAWCYADADESRNETTAGLRRIEVVQG